MERERLPVLAADPTKDAPSSSDTNGNGRDARGRFIAGNQCSKGYPHASTVAEFKQVVLATITPTDLARVVRKLVSMAIAGDTNAARLILDRCLGRVAQPTPIEVSIFRYEDRDMRFD